MLGLIGLGDYWEVEGKRDGAIDSLHPNLWLKQKYAGTIHKGRKHRRKG